MAASVEVRPRARVRREPVVRGLVFSLPRRQDRLPARPLRLRQDDGVALPRRIRAGARRDDRALGPRRVGDRARRAARAAQRSAWCSRTTRCFRTSTSRATSRSACALEPRRARIAHAQRCSSWSAWSMPRASIRTSCRAASSSASRWRARSRRSRELLLLDEPFSNLDVDLRERLSVEVRAILKEAGITAILVTHDQHEAFAIADEIGIMKRRRDRAVGQRVQPLPPAAHALRRGLRRAGRVRAWRRGRPAARLVTELGELARPAPVGRGAGRRGRRAAAPRRHRARRREPVARRGAVEDLPRRRVPVHARARVGDARARRSCRRTTTTRSARGSASASTSTTSSRFRRVLGLTS